MSSADHQRWYELALGTFHRGDLGVAPRRGEEHNPCDTIRLYLDTLRDDSMRIVDPHVRAPSQQDLKIAECVAAHNTDSMEKVARIDEREKERFKWKTYNRSIHKFRAGLPQTSSSKGNSCS